MIRPLDEIPQTPKTHWKTYRQKIREDIQEALDKGISKFEFVGDEYNYKTLGQTVREEADRMNRTMVMDAMRKARDEDILEGIPTYSVYELKAVFPLHISTIKGEKEKERRVFCEIDTIDDFKERVIGEYMAISKAKQERRERNRKLMESREGNND